MSIPEGDSHQKTAFAPRHAPTDMAEIIFENPFLNTAEVSASGPEATTTPPSRIFGAAAAEDETEELSPNGTERTELTAAEPDCRELWQMRVLEAHPHFGSHG